MIDLSNYGSDLDALWADYREAVPDPEVSVEFMPKLWSRIDAQRSKTEYAFRHFARICVAITVASIVAIASVSIPLPNNDEYSFATYVDLIAVDQVDEDVMQSIAIP